MYEKQIKEIRKNPISTSEYRSRMTEKAAKKTAENDLRKSQRTCERLDSDNVSELSNFLFCIKI